VPQNLVDRDFGEAGQEGFGDVEAGLKSAQALLKRAQSDAVRFVNAESAATLLRA
jgi:hypothetical protein